MLYDPAAVARALAILLAPGQVTELRVLGGKPTPDSKGGIFSGYFDDPAALVRALVRALADLRGGWEGVYIVPNPVLPDLLARKHNRIGWCNRGESTTDAHVTARRWLLVDVDPVRPRGISSTQTEHDLALDRARTIRADLIALGWPEPILASSGNGAHLVWRVDLPADSDLPKRMLAALAHYDDAAATVDPTVCNPARIWKLYGTLARKGDSRPDRPHRMATILAAPAEPLPVPVELLQAYIAEHAPVPVARPTPPARPPRATTATNATTTGGGFDPLAVAAAGGLQLDEGRRSDNGATIHPCLVCPCERRETDRAAFMSVSASGAVGLGCQHATCDYSGGPGTRGEHWKRWRAANDPNAYQPPPVDRTTLEAKAAAWSAAQRAAPSAQPATGKSAASRNDSEPTPAPQLQRGDEAELGSDLARCLGNPEDLACDEDRVWHYRDGVWHPQDDMLLAQRALRYAGREVGLGPKTVKLSAGNVRGIVDLCKTCLYTPGFFEAATYGAPFRGQFARIDDGQLVLEPLAREHRVKLDQVPAYDLPEGATQFLYGQGDLPRPVRTDRLLRETWAGCDDVEARITYIYEWLGAAICGIATRYKDSPLLVGRKDSGKSKVLDVIASVFPLASRRSVALQDMGRDCHRAHLSGGRINFVNELPAKEVMDGEAAKAILSGDTVACRQPYGRVYDWTSRCAHAFACNNLPPAQDLALMARFVVLDCPNVLPRQAQDRELKAKIEAEAPLIALVALRSLLDLLARGHFDRPPSSVALADQWRMEGDPVAFWAHLSIRKCADGAFASATLYEMYSIWAQKNGYHGITLKTFGTRLLALDFERHRSNGAKYRVALVGVASRTNGARWSPQDG